jgi:hypothetical protein
VPQRNSAKLPTPADDHDRKLLADVKKHGWHVIAVEADEDGPAFAYSIGLQHTFKHPEMIVFGLDVRVMHSMINGIGEEVKNGSQFEHLDESDDVLDGYNVCFRTVEKRHYPDYFGYARWFYRGDKFPALQCVWPDAQHRYPWHPESHEKFRERHPILSDDVSWPFHEGKNHAAFTTKPVLRGGLSILLVVHDKDGDWQFLCGTTNQSRDGQVVSLGCILQHDPTLAAVADLPLGCQASRKKLGGRWRREQVLEEDPEAPAP